MSARLLHRFPMLEACGADDINAAMTRHWQAVRVEIASDASRASVNFCRLTHTTLSYSEFDGIIAFDFPGNGTVRQKIALEGGGWTGNGETRRPLGVGQTALLQAGEPINLQITGRLQQVVLSLDTDALARKLGGLLGIAPPEDLRFEVLSPLRSPELQHLRRLIMFLVQELDHGEVVSSLALAELEQAIMASFLSAHRHRYSPVLRHEPAAAASRHVHLAEEYIAAHWNAPLTIEAIAAHTGVGVRSLFKAFQRVRGYSPKAFAKRVRLEQAQQMLRAPDPQTSVIGVAFACGFANPGNFARDYRTQFGELPSQTLRNAHLRRAP